MGFNQAVISNHAIFNDTPGFHDNAVTNMARTFKDRIHIQYDVTAKGHSASNINARRVQHPNACAHQLLRLSALKKPLRCGELNQVIHATDRLSLIRRYRSHRQALVHRNRDNICQVVLCLPVIIGQAG